MRTRKRYKRLKANPSLHLHHEDQFEGLEVYTDRGPLIREFLDQLYDTTYRALKLYPRVFAARFDLRFPQIDPISRDYDSNKFISTFFETLKRLIKRDRELSGLERRVHQTDVRYVWAREVGRSGKPHYHCVLLLNNDAYFKLGSPRPDHANLYGLLERAWALTLRLEPDEAFGLVYKPERAEYRLSVGDHADEMELEAFFYRASYLCKVHTKVFGGLHCFGCSDV